MKILLFFLMLLSFSSVFAQHPDDYRWDDRFSKPGISNPEYNGAPIRGALALAANNDYVIVGGRFTVPGNNIALWNKRTLSWEKAGSGVWKNPLPYDYPEVQKIIALGDTVFVSGKFTSAGDVPADGFAVFNTRTKMWSADTLFSGLILAAARNGSEVIISGVFSIKGTSIQNTARWHNGQWSAFSSDTTMIPGIIVPYKGGLYSIVKYTTQNDTRRISEWTGTVWKPVVREILGVPMQNLTLRSTQDYLYIFGGIDSMELASGQMAKCGNVVRYDGAAWHCIFDGGEFDARGRLVALDGENIYIAGDFTAINGYNANHIAKWDNATARWAALGSGIAGDDFGMKINALLVTDNQVYAAGQFATAGSQNVNNIARYDQSTFTWYPLGDAKTQAPNIIGVGDAFVFNDNNRLLVTGDFEYAGEKRLNSVGYWNGTAWENAGTGILGGAGYTYTGLTRVFVGPRGLTQYARIGRTLYLGGTFEEVGAASCENIITYDNGLTECVGGGVTQSFQGSGGSFFYPAAIDAMIAIGNSLYVGGNFTKAGTTTVQSIAEWNGTQWSDVGGGFKGAPYGGITFAEDSSHSLIAAGGFFQAGTAACNGLASWNGKEWKAIGYTPGDSGAVVNALCVAPNGDIWIAGYLSSAGYKGPGSLMRLVGDRFELVTEIFQKEKNTGGISVMACKGDLLYVAGGFDHIGDIEANNVAVYNMKTQKWAPLGSGFVKTTTQDTVTYNQVSVQTIAFIGDTVYFGGGFTYAGGKPSFSVAAWLPAKSNSIEHISATASASSLSIQPNPTSSSATITFTIPQAEHVSITLRDALGREVQRVSEGILQAGEYQTHIDCSALAVGAYYCVMAGVNGVQSQVLVITR